MARPKSEEKRLALLEAAAQILADHGIAAAPTSQIAKLAGVAEGTLFRYFATKDVLFNELYTHIKLDLYEKLRRSYVATAPFESRFQALWNSYIDWGLAHPVANKAINQLTVSSVVTSETRSKTDAAFPETGIQETFANGVFGGHVEYADAVFTAVADATMECVARNPSQGENYKRMGFAALQKMYAAP